MGHKQVPGQLFHTSLGAFCEQHWMVEREQPYEYIYNAITVRENGKQRRYLQPAFASIAKEQKSKSRSESFLGPQTPPSLSKATLVPYSQLTAPTIPSQQHLHPQKACRCLSHRVLHPQRASCCCSHHGQTPSASRTRKIRYRHGPCS